MHDSPFHESPAAGSYRITFTVGEHAVLHLRRIVRMYLFVWDMKELSCAAELALTELLTNVVRHVPDRRCALRILRQPEGLRVEIADGSRHLPVVRSAGLLAEGGRGLRLVEAVTDKWGVDPAPDGEEGKTVWFECAAKSDTRGGTYEPVR